MMQWVWGPEEKATPGQENQDAAETVLHTMFRKGVRERGYEASAELSEMYMRPDRELYWYEVDG